MMARAPSTDTCLGDPSAKTRPVSAFRLFSICYLGTFKDSKLSTYKVSARFGGMNSAIYVLETARFHEHRVVKAAELANEARRIARSHQRLPHEHHLDPQHLIPLHVHPILNSGERA